VIVDDLHIQRVTALPSKAEASTLEDALGIQISEAPDHGTMITLNVTSSNHTAVDLT
jgi:hypothetical protein